MAKKRAIANSHLEGRQLTLWDRVDNSSQKNGSCVPPRSVTHEPTHEQKVTAWVQIYPVTSHGKKHKYYRFCYLEEPGSIGSCVRVHLPGGNIQNPKAIALKEKVESAIRDGMSVSQIVQIIKSSTRS